MGRLSQINFSSIDGLLALGLLGAFVGFCMLATFVYRAVVEPMQKRRALNKRLRSNKREQEFRAQIFKAYQESRTGPVLAFLSWLTGWGKVENLQRQLLQADIYLTPGVFVGIVAFLGCLGVFLGVKLDVGPWAWVMGGSLGLFPIVFLRWKKMRKTAKFEKHMPEAMDLLARSLRAGHTLPATLELVAQEVPAPLGSEMRTAYEEQRLGLSISQALRRMGERVASRDLRYFVTAVLIQNESGGNLAEILENIGNLIRERMKLRGKVQALTAEGRFSALILIGLPFVTFLALFILNRTYIMVLLLDPLGKKILTAAILSIVVGALVMKKMVAIKV
jgi:tight adherence protein B